MGQRAHQHHSLSHGWSLLVCMFIRGTGPSGAGQEEERRRAACLRADAVATADTNRKELVKKSF